MLALFIQLGIFSFIAPVFATALAPLEHPIRRATTCNGSPSLCDRTFGNVTYVGTHDSYAIGVNNLAANQDQSVTQQLNDGVRMLQSQAHNNSGVITLCHTSCSLYNGGTLEAYLTTVKSWLDANPNEVLSLLIVNIDDLPVSSYGTVFQAVGLDTVSYAPSSSPIAVSGWPTLGSMIDSGKRLVTFLDNGADLSSVPYIIDEFTNVWETAYDVTDPSFDCAVNRTTGNSATEMYLINHFLDQLVLGQPVPDIGALNQTNAASGSGSLGAQVDTCVSEYGRPPNFLLVDFYEYGGGSVFQVAAEINGVSYDPTTPIATPASTASAAGGSVSVTSTSLKSGTHTIILSQGLTSLMMMLSFIMAGSLLVF